MTAIVGIAHRGRVPPRRTADVYDWMVTDFVDAVRDLFKSRGHAFNINAEEKTETRFLIGVAGRLFNVEGDYQVGESTTGYDAIGCGRDVARGSLHTSAPFASLTSPEHRDLAALRAASDHEAGVGPPFTVMSTTTWTPGIFAGAW